MSDATIDMDIIRDEVHMYAIGLVNKEEFLIIMNEIREDYDLKPLTEIPPRLEALMDATEKMLDIGLEMINQNL